MSYIVLSGLTIQEISGGNSATADCKLLNASTVLDDAVIVLPPNGEAALYLSGNVTPTSSGSFTVTCKQSGLGSADIQVGHMTIIQVGALN